MKLLPEKYGQAAAMTVTDGPGVNAKELGHWYSPAAVARFVAEEREARAKVADRWICSTTGATAMDKRSNLNDPKLTTILFAILVKRLGGKTTITQVDIDDIAYNALEEEGKDDGSIEFRFIERPRAG